MPAAQDKAMVEKLVEQVRSYPVLYDTSMQEHKDAQLLRYIWTCIAETMGDTSLDGEGWKKKWISLRDTYTRRKRELVKNGPTASAKKPWVFYDLLSFLDEYPCGKRTAESDFPPISFQKEESESCRLETVSDDESPTTRDEQQGFPRCSSITSPVGRKRPREAGSTNSVDFAIKELVDMKRSQCAAEKEEAERDPDGDEAFFKSCSRRMKKLTPQARSFLKLQISQLFFNAENPTLPPMSITPLMHTFQPTTATPTGSYTNVIHQHTNILPQHAASTSVPSISNTGDLIRDAMNRSEI
ncbi:uncharacterized protein LOC101850874 isoform X2 [Aplysia californica]|uniref:Uncharacterized protein LOC101850874 isoform X2 n=1 Tax=Aplysia californica TaxID=6500 RepID=A0ABM0JJB9_APLCA|nr:uncharacterized protein LOC101850874 isoform X2 [Aplysia californica]